VQPVGTHDQVEGARLAALEADLGAVLALGDLGEHLNLLQSPFATHVTYRVVR
jgi:hypothetical protein